MNKIIGQKVLRTDLEQAPMPFKKSVSGMGGEVVREVRTPTIQKFSYSPSLKSFSYSTSLKSLLYSITEIIVQLLDSFICEV
jgi:hypothetical protein